MSIEFKNIRDKTNLELCNLYDNKIDNLELIKMRIEILRKINTLINSDSHVIVSNLHNSSLIFAIEIEFTLKWIGSKLEFIFPGVNHHLKSTPSGHDADLST